MYIYRYLRQIGGSGGTARAIPFARTHTLSCTSPRPMERAGTPKNGQPSATGANAPGGSPRRDAHTLPVDTGNRFACLNEDGADSGKGTEGASGQHTNRPDSEMRGNEREEEVGEGKQKTGKPRAWGGAGPLVPMYLDGVELAQASAILARHLSEHGLGRVATEAGYGISFSRVRDKNRPDNKGMFVRYREKLAQSLIMDEKAAERVTRAVGHTQWRMKAWVEGRYRVLDGRERVVVTTHTVMCGGVAMGRTDIQEAEREIEQHLDHQLDNKAVKVRVCTRMTEPPLAECSCSSRMEKQRKHSANSWHGVPCESP